MNILSPLILLHSPCVRRLHESAPHKMPPHQPKPPPKPTTQEAQRRTPSPPGSNTEVQEDEVEQDVNRVETKTVPANMNTQWSEEEI